MHKRDIFCIVLAIFFWCQFIGASEAYSGRAHSGPLSVWVWSTSGNSGKIVQFRDGDPVQPSTRFQVRVDIQGLRHIGVTFRRPGSKDKHGTLTFEAELKQGTKVPPGETVWRLPDEEGSWTMAIHVTGQEGRDELVTQSFVVSRFKTGKQASFSKWMKGTAVSSEQTSLPAFANKLSPESLSSASTYSRAIKLASIMDAPFRFRGGAVSLYASMASRVVKVITNEGSGSGSLISSDGKILTNWHVVKGYQTVGVLFKPESKTGPSSDHVFIASVIRVNEITDLALLQLKDQFSGLKPIQLFNEEIPRIGENVHAIGHPQGQDWTYTRGYISQIRENFEWPASATASHKATVIQTQTPINPGNSGGPLLNDEGKLVGVNSFMRANSQGINYAVSIKNVRHFLGEKSDRRLAHIKYPERYAIDHRSVIKALDKNGNGTVDTTVMDINGNGVPDLISIDKDEDGQSDLIILDLNENGRPEARIKPVMKDGVWMYVWGVDEDEDGNVESLCIDLDGDFKIDRCVKA